MVVLSVDRQRPRREEEAAGAQANETLEKLNQGSRETKQMAKPKTMERAQEYFGCSVTTLE